jgi:hypothetical protein
MVASVNKTLAYFPKYKTMCVCTTNTETVFCCSFDLHMYSSFTLLGTYTWIVKTVEFGPYRDLNIRFSLFRMVVKISIVHAFFF